MPSCGSASGSVCLWSPMMKQKPLEVPSVLKSDWKLLTNSKRHTRTYKLWHPRAVSAPAGLYISLVDGTLDLLYVCSCSSPSRLPSRSLCRSCYMLPRCSHGICHSCTLSRSGLFDSGCTVQCGNPPICRNIDFMMKLLNFIPVVVLSLDSHFPHFIHITVAWLNVFTLDNAEMFKSDTKTKWIFKAVILPLWKWSQDEDLWAFCPSSDNNSTKGWCNS